MKIKKLTTSSLLIAIGVVASSIVYIPVGAAKCFPIQHMINVLAAVLLGPWYGVAIAFCISSLRNILGTGTLLAFPGSMIGALVAGVVFAKTQKLSLAAIGEVFGTGILGAVVAYPIAKFVLGKEVALFFYVIPFLTSTIGGSIIGFILLKSLSLTKIIKLGKSF